jgi:hypothetical protein
VPSPPPSTTSSDYEDRAAAKAAALWSERSSSEGGDLSGSNVLRGSIEDRLLNTKFDSESARSMVRMVRTTAPVTAQFTTRTPYQQLLTASACAPSYAAPTPGR